MRINDLERFNALVTIDMRAHFAALAEQERVKLAGALHSPVKRSALDTAHLGGSAGPARQHAVGESSSGQHPNSDSLSNVGIDVSRDMDDAQGGPGGTPAARRPQGVAEGRVKQNTMADSMSHLEQHMGIYARLCCLGPDRGAARAARALHCDDPDEDDLPEPPSRSRSRLVNTKTQPMELQVRTGIHASQLRLTLAPSVLSRGATPCGAPLASDTSPTCNSAPTRILRCLSSKYMHATTALCIVRGFHIVWLTGRKHANHDDIRGLAAGAVL